MKLPRPPAAVTFDCWSTLISDIDWEETFRTRCRSLIEMAARQGVDLDPEKAMELIESSWQEHVSQWRAGKVFGSKGAARWVLDRLGLGRDSEQIGASLAAELTAAIEDATSEVGTRVVEGAVEAVESLRSAGIPTALICDTGFTPARHVRRFLDQHGLKLDHYFFSELVGAPKPLPPMFHAALTATASSPERAIHIGDLKRTDIAGARAAGMATIRFIGVHDDGWTEEESRGEEADEVLGAWQDLPALLGL